MEKVEKLNGADWLGVEEHVNATIKAFNEDNPNEEPIKVICSNTTKVIKETLATLKDKGTLDLDQIVEHAEKKGLVLEDEVVWDYMYDAMKSTKIISGDDHHNIQLI